MIVKTYCKERDTFFEWDFLELEDFFDGDEPVE